MEGSPPATSRLTPLRLLTVALCVVAIAILAPFALPLILAAWIADILEPPVRWLERVLRGRRRAAGAVVVGLMVGSLVLLGGLVAFIGAGAQEFIAQARAAVDGQGSFASALLGENSDAAKAQQRDWSDIASRYGASGWRAITVVLRASAGVGIGVMVFLFALYTFVVDGNALRAWLEKHAPIPVSAFTRLATAFRETGRGLIVASGGTALLQGIVATAAYAAIGIPRALLLGPLTALCSIVPFVGTALVWAPLGIELWLAGHHGRAVAVGLAGIVISTLDNFIRPVLARYGRLRLPTFAVLLSLLGGIALFGAAGAIVGPLLVRLCVEALALLSEARAESGKRSA